MKIAIVYNRNSQSVINLFGMPNREKIGMKTISRLADALRKGGHQVMALEGDKDLIDHLEDFMPRVVHGERPGMVFNVSYGLQGQARYTHVPSILEMVGIPYVASGPMGHSLSLDKVVTKMILQAERPAHAGLHGAARSRRAGPRAALPDDRQAAQRVGLLRPQGRARRGGAPRGREGHLRRVQAAGPRRAVHRRARDQRGPPRQQPAGGLAPGASSTSATAPPSTATRTRPARADAPSSPSARPRSARRSPDARRRSPSAPSRPWASTTAPASTCAWTRTISSTSSRPTASPAWGSTAPTSWARPRSASTSRASSTAWWRWRRPATSGPPSPRCSTRSGVDTRSHAVGFVTQRREAMERRLRDWVALSSPTSDPVGIQQAVQRAGDGVRRAGDEDGGGADRRAPRLDLGDEGGPGRRHPPRGPPRRPRGRGHAPPALPPGPRVAARRGDRDVARAAGHDRVRAAGAAQHPAPAAAAARASCSTPTRAATPGTAPRPSGPPPAARKRVIVLRPGLPERGRHPPAPGQPSFPAPRRRRGGEPRPGEPAAGGPPLDLGPPRGHLPARVGAPPGLGRRSWPWAPSATPCVCRTGSPPPSS